MEVGLLRTLSRIFVLATTVGVATLVAAAAPASAAPAGEIYQIENAVSGRCIVVQNKPGATAFTYSCSGDPNDQNWWFAYVGNDSRGNEMWSLQNSESGLCLVVQGLNPGTVAFATPCDTRYIDQLWVLDGNGIETENSIQNGSSNGYLVSQNKGDGSPVFQFNNTFADSQWQLVATGS
ncbi:MAG TPA: RICIN domain-containing protein [Pseudonocardiaceae bacterium]